MKCRVLKGLESLLVPIGELNEDPKNARSHPDVNFEAVKRSLAELGQHSPLVVQRQGSIVRVGNCRLRAARALGWTHVAAVITDESDVVAMARAIADNRTAELAEWDQDELADIVRLLHAELSETAEGLLSVEVTGFSEREIEKILARADRGGSTDPDQRIEEAFQVLVICKSEKEQASLLARLSGEGFECKSLIS